MCLPSNNFSMLIITNLKSLKGKIQLSRKKKIFYTWIHVQCPMILQPSICNVIYFSKIFESIKLFSENVLYKLYQSFTTNFLKSIIIIWYFFYYTMLSWWKNKITIKTRDKKKCFYFIFVKCTHEIKFIGLGKYFTLFFFFYNIFKFWKIFQNDVTTTTTQ